LASLLAVELLAFFTGEQTFIFVHLVFFLLHASSKTWLATGGCIGIIGRSNTVVPHLAQKAGDVS
jgi:hypothetical protein